jgi:hypothetical protein
MVNYNWRLATADEGIDATEAGATLKQLFVAVLLRFVKRSAEAATDAGGRPKEIII